ncbi:unnamed protein product [Caenorhabditis bovis]|nr:unnamed protein product [Caenorhabditis bovis]
MLYVINSGQSLFCSKSERLILTRSSKRDAKKRKGVHFDADDGTSSTSDYIFQEGKQWGQIATSFNCDDSSENELNVMDELLNLCNWNDPKEKMPNFSFTDDEDDDIPFATNCSNSIYPTPPSTSSTDDRSLRVSNLHLTSRLRLDSKPILVAQRKLKSTVV